MIRCSWAWGQAGGVGQEFNSCKNYSVSKLAGAGTQTWSKARQGGGGGGMLLDSLGELNERGRESRLISMITDHLQACIKSS